MNRSASPPIAWTRLVLLLAVLANFAGAVLAPSVHPVWEGIGGSAPTLSEPASERGVPHDELGCWLCQALGEVLLTGSRAVSPRPGAQASAGYARSEERVPSRVAAHVSRARAPPHA